MIEQSQKPKLGRPRSGRKIVRLPLTSLAGLIKEAGRVYRRMKDGKMDHDQGRSLVWVLTAIRGMLEAQHLERIEAKLDALAQTAETGGGYHGHAGANRETRLPH